jgi:hypothetical protein
VPDARVARIAATERVRWTADGPGCIRARARPGNELVLHLDGTGTFRVRGEGLFGYRLRDATHDVDGESVYSLLPRGSVRIVSMKSAGSGKTPDNLLVLTLPVDRPTVLCDVVG